MCPMSESVCVQEETTGIFHAQYTPVYFDIVGLLHHLITANVMEKGHVNPK